MFFKEGKDYSRDFIRENLYEYYAGRVAWIRNDPNNKNDGARHWYVAKAVKDYLNLINVKSMRYEEIQELIKCRAILNYANDMIYILMNGWIKYMDRL